MPKETTHRLPGTVRPEKYTIELRPDLTGFTFRGDEFIAIRVLQPVKMIVPYPPGGGVDIMARALAEPLGRVWGHAVVVDNKPGGGTIIGAELAARAVPDGRHLQPR